MQLKAKYEVLLDVSDRKHRYHRKGSERRYPGATEPLGVLAKPYLVPWAAKEAANRIKAHLHEYAVNRPLTAEEIDDLIEDGRRQHIIKLEKAADIGTRAHGAVDHWIKIGSWPVLEEDIKQAVDNFRQWIREQDITFIAGDTKVLNEFHGYGGSIDAMAIQGKKTILVDFKTSNSIQREYAYQVAAYWEALYHTYGVRTDELMVVRFGKTKPDFEAKVIKNPGECFAIFEHCLAIYESKNKEVFTSV